MFRLEGLLGIEDPAWEGTGSSECQMVHAGRRCGRDPDHDRSRRRGADGGASVCREGPPRPRGDALHRHAGLRGPAALTVHRDPRPPATVDGGGRLCRLRLRRSAVAALPRAGRDPAGRAAAGPDLIALGVPEITQPRGSPGNWPCSGTHRSTPPTCYSPVPRRRSKDP